MNTPGKRTGFSLIEVVIATGIFAVAVTVTLALLPALSRLAADQADALVAQRLPDGLQVELTRLAAGNYDGLAAAVPVMTAPLANGFVLGASRDGSRLHSLSYRPPPASGMVPAEEQYFLVEAWRFERPPLGFDPTGTVLPLYVRVSWPYRLPGNPVVINAGDRRQVLFTVALSR